jgi:transposase
MQGLPDLTQLSHQQKDELILLLWSLVQEQAGQIREQAKQIAALQAKVQELEGRLSLNSKNSSKPPSSDGLTKPKPKSLRKSQQRSSGGQAGHKGETLRQVDSPDIVVDHAPPAQCDLCDARLEGAEVIDKRQVFDLPPLCFEVTEHRLLQAQCACGKVHRGQFPDGVRAPVQYGPTVLAAMVHLSTHHMLPLKRTADLLSDFFRLPVSQAVVLQACSRASETLKPVVQSIAQALQTSAVLHADETGMRVNKALHWVHVAATETLTWLGSHLKRGSEAFNDLGLLPNFKGTLCHDGLAAYRLLDCMHSCCNAHHLRELTYLLEEQQQAWAGDMIELLSQANHEVHQLGTPLPPTRLANYRWMYDLILMEGETRNPIVQASASGKRGRTKQSKATNLLIRLRQYADDVWRFASDEGVPFTNNTAEQAVRMPKVKQKISGGFRTNEGLATFCVIRSYLATLHKQGINVFDALVNTLKGDPVQPNLTAG